MKGMDFLRALAVGASISLGGALAPARLAMPARHVLEQSRSKGKGNAPTGALRRAIRTASGRLLDSGFWRPTRTFSLNPKGTPEQQAARIVAATERRKRRALLADRNIWRGYLGNPCLDCSDRKNPTFVNR